MNTKVTSTITITDRQLLEFLKAHFKLPNDTKIGVNISMMGQRDPHPVMTGITLTYEKELGV